MPKSTLQQARDFKPHFEVRTETRYHVELSQPFNTIEEAETAYNAIKCEPQRYYSLLQYFVDGSTLPLRHK